MNSKKFCIVLVIMWLSSFALLGLGLQYNNAMVGLPGIGLILATIISYYVFDKAKRANMQIYNNSVNRKSIKIKKLISAIIGLDIVLVISLVGVGYLVQYGNMIAGVTGIGGVLLVIVFTIAIIFAIDD